MNFLYSKKAQKDIKKIETLMARKILLQIQKWENGDIQMPIPKMLVGIKSPQYRIRIGDYRVRGYITESEFKVLRIRHRSDIYKDL